MPEITIPAIIFVDGLVCVLFSIFAHVLGLDSTPNWGYPRVILLLCGIILICIAIAAVLPGTLKNKISRFLQSEPIKVAFSVAHLWGLILLIYIWFITFGNFTTWDHTTHYYTQLATAFSKGRLYVDLKPGQALAEAPDPYHPTDRPPFNDELWDMSLYQGKLFLYWGPVPALLIAPIQMVLMKKITDNYLVFFFFSGLLIFNSLILIKLRKLFYPTLPAGILLISIALAGLVLPIPWSLSTPNVYEAAIGAGQFFLMGGIYFIISALENEPGFNRKALFLAGAFWACAVGSRAINVFSVIFLAALTSFWIAKKMPRPFGWTKYVQNIAALYFPLIAGAVLIGWYNWMRFDSPFEFGLRYQITIFNLNKDMNLAFRPEYFLFNAHTYLFQPFQIISHFPFLQPVIVSSMLDEQGISTPYLYAAGRVTGLLFGAPFLALGLAGLLPIHMKSRISQFMNQPGHQEFVFFLISGSLLINFLHILFFFFGQLRYLVDVTSQAALLAILGYWRICSTGRDPLSMRPKLTIRLLHILVIFTICAGLLLAITGEANRMQILNPALFERMDDIFSMFT